MTIAKLSRRVFLTGFMTVGLLLTVEGLAFAQDKAAASVDGFRSAKFGAKIPDVKKAITKDLGIKSKDITESVVPVERRKMLTVKATDLLAESGESSVSYIFGHKSERLNQVAIVWENVKERDKVIATALALQSYFIGLGFPDKNRMINAPLNDGGRLFFRGEDNQGRLVILRLVPQQVEEGKEVKPEERALSLILNYMSDPANPDIFKVEKGAF